MRLRSTALACLLVLAARPAWAADLVIHVLPKEAEHAAPDGVVRLSKLSAALERASTHLSQCGACTVTIRVARGEQVGRAQVGQWVLPEVVAPDATLRILGGYDLALARRDPLRSPTVLVTAGRRSGPVFAVEGRKTALRELMISGFAFDVASGNNYDAKSGALMKGGSSSWPLLSFGGLRAEKLIVADNVFANAANGVAAPGLVVTGPDAEVVVRNNIFLHNVHCWVVVGLPTKLVVERYVVEGNTFYRNYPYNPDATTSNPGVLEIGSYAAKRVVIRGNLFAHNPGGAIFPQWDDRRGPPMTIEDNLFFQNGELFEAKTPGPGAVVGKFNGSALHHAYAPEELEEDFSWESRRNVVLDPQLGATAGRPDVPSPSPDGPAEEAEETTAGDDGVEVVSNAAIDSFAPRAILRFDALPLPRAAAAKKFGASPERVVTP